jgi:hypothetical protein
VGGNSGAILLNNVALLTMIGVAQKHCDLEWDQNRIDGAKEELYTQQFKISSERRSVWNKILLRGRRVIGDKQFNAQSIHSVFEELVNQRVELRGKRTRYRPKNVNEDVLSLPKFHLPLYEDIIRTAAKHAVR